LLDQKDFTAFKNGDIFRASQKYAGRKKLLSDAPGFEKIKKEYEELKQIKLSKTKGEVPGVLHSEDVNPEFLALQEDLGLLDIKMAELE